MYQKYPNTYGFFLFFFLSVRSYRIIVTKRAYLIALFPETLSVPNKGNVVNIVVLETKTEL